MLNQYICLNCYNGNCDECADKHKVFPDCQHECNRQKEEARKMNVHKLDVVAENGVPFRVVVLVDGKSENFNTASLSNKSLVEFYDRRYDFTPDGQFTGHRIYLDTALEASVYTMSFDQPSWQMDSRTSRTVRDWLHFLVDRESVRV